MDLGRVIGSVWATQKHEPLEGLKLYLVQPEDIEGNKNGSVLIAADTVGAGIGELVYYTTAYEAVIPLRKKPALCDASIVGIVEKLEVQR